MKKIKILTVCVLILSCLSLLNAADMKSKVGITPIGSVFGSNGQVFPKDVARFVVKGISFTKDTAYDGNNEVTDPIHREVQMNKLNFLFRYGLGNNFDIRMIVPYVSKEMKQTYPMGPNAGKELKLKNSGMGDSKVFIRYQALNQKKGDPVLLALGLGLKLPTGTTSKVFTTIQGKKETPTMQLGSGSLDIIAEIGLTKILPNSRIDAHTSYILKNKGSNNYEFGDQIHWNIGYVYSLNKYLGLGAELNGVHMNKDKSNGNTIDNSGGNFIFFTPGIQYRPNKSYDISLAYAHMIYRNNNYNSMANSGGLSEDNRIVFRVGYNF